MSEIVLEINQLQKNYKDVQALKSLSFNVHRGEVFGILGPNGSGKTTTLGILLGVLNSDKGSFSWFNNGQNDENRLRIGALLETPNFYPYLSAVDNLKIVARIKNMTNPENRIEEVLKSVQLFERKNSKFRTYSLGMKQRLAIASSMLNDPEILVLDEPTNGLDPEGIAEIRNLIKSISLQGKTIIIASHILDEIEKVCTNVAILRKGELLRIGLLSDIMSHDQIISVSSEDNSMLKKVAESMEGVGYLREDKDGSILLKVDSTIGTAQLNRLFFDKGITLSQLKSFQQTLEETFLEIVKS